jgi:hypothetical protein
MKRFRYFYFFELDGHILIVYYVMRSKNELLCAAAGRLAAERSEADKPAKAHKTIFAPNNIYYFFLQTFITNYLRHVIVESMKVFTS